MGGERRVRVLDVTVSVTTPVGYVPSPRTLGQDLRAKIMRRVKELAMAVEDIEAAVQRAIVAFLADWVLIAQSCVIEVVRERPGDGLVGVDVRMVVAS